MVQFLKRFGGVLAILLLIVTIVGCASLLEQPSPRGASVPVYMEQGGEKLVVATGGAIEVQAGGAIVLTPGATLDIGGASADNLVVNAPTAVGTATPAAYINNAGVSDQIVVADGGTVAFQMFNGGGARFAAPTAIATAVPGLIVDSLGKSNIVEFRDAATPVAAINNGGNVVFGTADGTGVDVTWYSDTAGDTMLWDQDAEALTITGTDGQDALNVDDGNVDIADSMDVDGDITFGADGLYPLGYASSGYEIECGTTSTFTATTTITATALSTVTVPLAVQVTDPITTAAYLSASDPTTTTVTFTSQNSSFGAGTTGIVVHYCLVGNQ
jgi:hypothetical protein